MSSPGLLIDTLELKRTRSPPILLIAICAPGAVERRARDVECRRFQIGPLKVVPAVFLDSIDRFGRALHVAADPVAGDRVALLESHVPVETAGERTVGKKGEPAVGAADRRRHHRADRGLVRELPADAANRVARRWLDRHPRRHQAGQHACGFFLRERLHDADRVVADASRQLPRAEDRGLRRRVGVDAFVARKIVEALRRTANPAAVEQTGAGAVVAVHREVEVARTLHEERPALGEERFERGQVHDRGIGFDLAEIRVDGAGEGQTRRQRVLHVDAERAIGRGMLEQRVAAGDLFRQVGQRVRDQLELLRRARHREAAQLAERRHVPVVAAGQQRPGRRFVEAADLPRHREAEGVRVRLSESQLRERDPELRGPSEAIARDADVPHRVPAVVAVVVVVPVPIHLHAGRVDRELVCGAFVVVGIDQDVDPVAGRIEIAPCEIGDDPVRVAVERADLYEEGALVVRDAKLRALTRRSRVVRLALHERVDRSGRTPRLLARLAGDPHRGRGRRDGGHRQSERERGKHRCAG